MSTKKQVILSVAQKYDICQAKEMDQNIKNIDLEEKEHWLAITIEEEGEVKKFHRPKWPKIEEALGLWIDNALNSSQDINSHILKKKANDMDDESKLTELIGCLSINDSLTAYEYIHAEDDEVKGRLTVEEFWRLLKAKIGGKTLCEQNTKLLYEQGSEFGDVDEEVKILRKLYKQVQLNIVKNLKQVDLHYYFQSFE
ncbi:16523_t:CDS:2 [Cetraspora pellucida]|uniref:16523_t:CDS:1 n=1 Tax=Cetraspora pellucida TaxID=1433469 RepID=A0ACA9LTD9_9GLOM|nr:16523_t:CDS:2 [Cetraspora pellucida]